MKRVIALIIAVFMIAGLCACGNTQDNSEKTKKESDGSIGVDENLLTVEVTMPAEFVEDTTQEALDAAVAESKCKSATLNEDGSVTYVMTKAQHKKMLKETTEWMEESLAELPGSDEYPNVVSVEANDNFTEFKVTTTNTELDMDESFSVLLYYMYGAMYNIVSGEDVDNINVKFINAATGEIIEEANSSDLSDDSISDMAN